MNKKLTYFLFLYERRNRCEKPTYATSVYVETASQCLDNCKVLHVGMAWIMTETLNAAHSLLTLDQSHGAQRDIYVERTMWKNNTRMSSSLAFWGIFNGELLAAYPRIKKDVVKGERAPGEYWAASITMATPLHHIPIAILRHTKNRKNTVLGHNSIKTYSHLCLRAEWGVEGEEFSTY